MVIVLLLGAILGGWLGEVLIKYVPLLSSVGQSYSIGIPRFHLDLRVVSLLFGFTLRINLFSLLGLVVGFLVYRRM